MKIRSLLLLATIIATASCTKDKEVLLCNPQTLLLKFTCGADLSGSDSLDFHVVRDDGVAVRFSTTLSCPGTRSFQVNVPDYVVGRTFRITATPMKAAVANGAPNSISGVALAASCTSIEFPLGAAGMMQIPVVDGGLGEPDASALSDSMPDVSSCTAGSLGCLCNDGTCGSGLVCRDSTCISPTCGNGQLDPGEDCDQGPSNTNDVDLCSLNCVACSKRPGFLACGDSCLTGAECCPGTPCGPAAVCAANSLTARAVCGSDGKCPAGKPAPCDSFLTCADGSSCRASCSGDGECVGGRRCQNGTCITPSCGNGKQEAGEQCDDGNSNDLDTCSNACVACANRSGFLACGSICIQGATCCPGSVCGAASCVGSTITPVQMCGSGGQCPVGTPASCGGNFVCEAGGLPPVRQTANYDYAAIAS